MMLLPRRITTVNALLASVVAVLLIVGFLHLRSSKFQMKNQMLDEKQISLPKLRNSTSSDATLTMPEYPLERDLSNEVCPGYLELRSINFNDTRLKKSLCVGLPAYTLDSRGRYPLCQLRKSLPIDKIIRAHAIKTWATNVFDEKKQVVIYGSRKDTITGALVSRHDWENLHIRTILTVAKKLPIDTVTFIDVGCNIGTYSLQARAAGFSTISLDANIRNVIRVKMAAEDMNLDDAQSFKPMWGMISDDVSLRRLLFDGGVCNVGGARQEYIKGIWDSVQVATSQADDLIQHIKTKHVVIKIDIESHEMEFFSTSHKLFESLKIFAVQMEFLLFPNREAAMPSLKKANEFFLAKNYVLYNMKLEKATFESVLGDNAIWVRHDMVHLM